MKFSKILPIFIFFAVMMSCSFDNENEGAIELKDVKEAIVSEQLRLKVEETEGKLKRLLESEGYKGINDESLIIGNLNKNNFSISTKKVENILSVYFKKLGLESGCDASFSSFEFLTAELNNGFPMVISKGVCHDTGEAISIGINLIESNDSSSFRVAPGTTVVCTGCTDGCSPRRHSNGDGYCTTCAEGGPSCIKTETL